MDDVRGDFLGPPHGTTQQIKIELRSFKSSEHINLYEASIRKRNHCVYNKIQVIYQVDQLANLHSDTLRDLAPLPWQLSMDCLYQCRTDHGFCKLLLMFITFFVMYLYKWQKCSSTNMTLRTKSK